MYDKRVVRGNTYARVLNANAVDPLFEDFS